jgi:hypothetical protein
MHGETVVEKTLTWAEQDTTFWAENILGADHPVSMFVQKFDVILSRSKAKPSKRKASRKVSANYDTGMTPSDHKPQFAGEI